MRALWLAHGALQNVQLDDPVPRAGECVVRVIQAGVCGTDLALLDGLYAFEGVPGHEFVGCVERGPPPMCGKRVVADINLGCGHCAPCRRGARKHCESRRVLGLRDANGAFAERLLVPAENLFEVGTAISDDAAVLTEPLAAALDVLEICGCNTPGQAMIVGAGRLGQLVARVLLRAGWTVHCHGRSRFGLERLPASVTRSRGLAPQRPFDLVVDTSASEQGLATALAAVRPRGTLVLKSTLGGRPGVDLNRLVVDEIRLLGSRCGKMDHALAWLEREDHDLEQLVTERFALDDGARAFSASADATQCKVLIVP